MSADDKGLETESLEITVGDITFNLDVTPQFVYQMLSRPRSLGQGGSVLPKGRMYMVRHPPREGETMDEWIESAVTLVAGDRDDP